MERSGNWSEFDLAGHVCEWYEPPESSPHGDVVIYLHGVHLNRLHDKPAFLREFDRHGLRGGCPVHVVQLVDRSDLRRVRHDDHRRTLRARSRAPVDSRAFARRGRNASRCWARAWEGRGRSHRLQASARFSVVAAISPAIDYHLRMDEGDETLPLMYSDREAARQDTATLHVHPLNWPRHVWFCCDPIHVRWHEIADRLRMKMSGAGHSVRARSGNQRRRARLRILQPHGAASTRLHRPARLQSERLRVE